MLQHWFDPIAIGIVFLGTVAATVLRCGWADARTTLAGLAGLLARRFDPAKAKAELAKQITDVAHSGFVRAEPRATGDLEFDTLSDLMIHQRSIQSLHGEHSKYKQRRTDAAQRAGRTLDCAAELAPVMGLAGTLIALGSAGVSPGGAPASDGLVEGIAMAVVTTLYGLMAANFLFAPLSAAIQRRSRAEEQDRDDVLAWLERGILRAEPGPRVAPVAADEDDGVGAQPVESLAA